MKEQLVKRFLRYVGFDTMSDPHNTKSRPSTANQMELLRVLQQELVQMGISDLTLDPNGYLIARLPATVEAPPIGFMAHVDVADDVMGNGVKPRLIEQYDGQDIVLANGLVLSTKENQELIAYKGEQLVVTDGTTLLGGDDKAGVAILMSVAAKLASDPSAKHPEVEFIFTTDEETGRGMDAFDISLIRSTVCYTVDGGSRGSVEAECFNAATATVDFYGIPYHLGAARGRMVSSLAMASWFISALPRSESPEATDGRYGYYHAEEISGTSAHTHVVVYLRDFDKQQLQRRIDVIKGLASTAEQLFVGGKATVDVQVVYENMYETIKKNPKVMDAVWQAAQELDIKLHQDIIRGGTDGARLAQMGIAAPNLYTGSHNLHSVYEWTAVSAMEESARLVEGIIAYWAKEQP